MPIHGPRTPVHTLAEAMPPNPVGRRHGGVRDRSLTVCAFSSNLLSLVARRIPKGTKPAAVRPEKAMNALVNKGKNHVLESDRRLGKRKKKR